MIKKAVAWLLVLSWMGFIFYFSAQPVSVSRSQSEVITANVQKIITEVTGKDSNEIEIMFRDHYTRKFGHMTLFFVFGFLLMYLFGTINMRHMYAAAFISIFTYAVTDEMHQALVPGRGPMVSDVFIDLAGGSIGIVIYSILRSVRTVLSKTH